MTPAAHAFVDVEEILSAARKLSITGRWERAARLLTAATADEPAARARMISGRPPKSPWTRTGSPGRTPPPS
ncbi:hypothetical protein [Streptomyces sp. NPDC002550]